MSTMTRNRKSVKPFSCSFVSITIEISDIRYSVDEIPAGEFGSKAFRLTKHSGDHAVYDVVHNAYGCVACDCPDYIARHDGTSSLCKHGRALVTLGLMPAPSLPAVVPHVPDEFDAPAPARNRLDECDPFDRSQPAPAACCSPAEPEPCRACERESAGEPPADPAPADLPGELADPGDSESDPELWPDGWDDHVWNLGPDAPDDEAATAGDLAEASVVFAEMTAREHLDASDRLTLAELVDRQVEFYDGWNNAAGRMLAAHLAELALKVRMVDATTPADYDARIEVLDRDVRDGWMEAGRLACQVEPEMTSAGRIA